jgi:hypothetical protein
MSADRVAVLRLSKKLEVEKLAVFGVPFAAGRAGLTDSVR